jgi:hypothetical protein
MHIGAAGYQRDQPLAGADQILLFLARCRRRTHTDNAVLAMEHHVAALRNKGRDQGRHADAQIDQPVILQIAGDSGGDLFAC